MNLTPSSVVPAEYPSRSELLKIHVDHNSVKSGFLKAVTAQHDVAYRLCRKFESVCKVDIGADAARARMKRLNKVQEYWFDRVLEELDKTRAELREAKEALWVRLACCIFVQFFPVIKL